MLTFGFRLQAARRNASLSSLAAIAHWHEHASVGKMRGKLAETDSQRASAELMVAFLKDQISETGQVRRVGVRVQTPARVSRYGIGRGRVEGGWVETLVCASKVGRDRLLGDRVRRQS